MKFFIALLAILALGYVPMAESFWIHVPKGGFPTDPAAADPETTAAAEPETTAAAEPVTTAAAEPETTAAAEPETTAAAGPETTAAAEPETTAAAAEPEITAATEPETTAAADPESIAAVEPGTTAMPEFSCVGKLDGNYDIGCSNIFVSCVGESVIYLHCPDDLIYDSASGSCLEAEYVTVCGGGSSSSTTPTTKVPQAPPEFSCEDKEDGVYGMGCSGTFVSCVDGEPVYLECPAKLIFDSVSVRCLLREHVSACGGSPTPAEPVISPATEPVMTTAEAATKPSTEAPMETTAAAPEGATTTKLAASKLGRNPERPLIGASFK